MGSCSFDSWEASDQNTTEAALLERGYLDLAEQERIARLEEEHESEV